MREMEGCSFLVFMQKERKGFEIPLKNKIASEQRASEGDCLN